MGNSRIRFYCLLLGISLLALLLRCLGLGVQPLTADDVLVAVSAWNYVESGNLGPTMWNHPPLRNLFVYLSISLLGSGIWGLKIVSVSLGALAVPCLGLVCERLFRNSAIALLAALFLAVDPLHIDFSRQAVHENYMLTFALAGILCALIYRDGRSKSALIFAAVCFGLGLASKWYVASALLVTWVYLVCIDSLMPNDESVDKIWRGLYITAILTCIPLLVYLLTFIPWFQRGYGIEEWFSLQQIMYRESLTHVGNNPYGLEIDHKAFLWFIKPVAYADFAFSKGKPTVLLGISNPVVWMLTMPAIAWLAFRWIKERNIECLFLSALFWTSYIPFLLTARPILVNSVFAVLPFSFMAVSCFVVNTAAKVARNRVVLFCYIVLVIACAIPLFLLATGKGLDNSLLHPVVELYKPSYDWGQ